MANGSSDWRALCAAAATEEDSAKLTSLVTQIIQKLDEHRAQRNPLSGDCIGFGFTAFSPKA